MAASAYQLLKLLNDLKWIVCFLGDPSLTYCA